MSKNKKSNLYLTKEQRPSFAPWHSVHKSKKDKEKSRQVQKRKLKEYKDENL